MHVCAKSFEDIIGLVVHVTKIKNRNGRHRRTSKDVVIMNKR